MRLFNLISRGVLVAATAGYGMAQTQVDLRTQAKSIDFSAASSTKPMQTGASLPATCAVGAMFLNTSAPVGQNVYACTAVNTWSPEGGGSGTPSPAGNANMVLSNNGSTLLWQPIGGDASGAPSAVKVTGLQGRGVATTAPTAGQVLSWNATAGQWAPSNPAAVGGAYSSSFTAQTSVTIAGTAHQLNSANLLVTCYDTQTPAMEVEPNSVAVNATTFDVTVTFTTAQSGRCVVSSGGAGGTGGGINLGASNTYVAGAKQTMAASATTAGLSVTPGALPTNAVAGDLAVDANAGNVLKTFNGTSWSAAAGGGGAYAGSFTAQTSVTIAGTAHQLNTANLVVSCFDTSTPAMEVDPDTVSVNLTTYDVTINFAQPQSGRCVVSSGGGGGSGGSGGASMAAQLKDFVGASSSSTILTIGGNCSATTPCNVRLGNQTYSFATSATVTLTSGSGLAYAYVDVNGQLTVGHNLTLSCVGCTAVSGITGFPPNAVPLFTWLATNGTWYAGGPTDYRAFLGSQNMTAGTGVTVANNGSTMLVGVDTAVVPTYLMASGTLSFPSIGAGTCAVDQTLPFPGAAAGDAVAPGWPASLPAGVIGTMWVSSSGTLSVRLCNLSAATVSAASNTFSAADVRSF